MYKVQAEVSISEPAPLQGSNYNFAGLPGIVLCSYIEERSNRLTINLIVAEREGETVVINEVSYVFETQYDEDGNPLGAGWRPYNESKS